MAGSLPSHSGLCLHFCANQYGYLPLKHHSGVYLLQYSIISREIVHKMVCLWSISWGLVASPWWQQKQSADCLMLRLSYTGGCHCQHAHFSDEWRPSIIGTFYVAMLFEMTVGGGVWPLSNDRIYISTQNMLLLCLASLILPWGNFGRSHENVSRKRLHHMWHFLVKCEPGVIQSAGSSQASVVGYSICDSPYSYFDALSYLHRLCLGDACPWCFTIGPPLGLDVMSSQSIAMIMFTDELLSAAMFVIFCTKLAKKQLWKVVQLCHGGGEWPHAACCQRYSCKDPDVRGWQWLPCI